MSAYRAQNEKSLTFQHQKKLRAAAFPNLFVIPTAPDSTARKSQ